MEMMQTVKSANHDGGERETELLLLLSDIKLIESGRLGVQFAQQSAQFVSELVDAGLLLWVCDLLAFLQGCKTNAKSGACLEDCLELLSRFFRRVVSSDEHRLQLAVDIRRYALLDTLSLVVCDPQASVHSVFFAIQLLVTLVFKCPLNSGEISALVHKILDPLVGWLQMEESVFGERYNEEKTRRTGVRSSIILSPESFESREKEEGNMDPEEDHTFANRYRHIMHDAVCQLLAGILLALASKSLPELQSDTYLWIASHAPLIKQLVCNVQDIVPLDYPESGKSLHCANCLSLLAWLPAHYSRWHAKVAVDKNLRYVNAVSNILVEETREGTLIGRLFDVWRSLRSIAEWKVVLMNEYGVRDEQLAAQIESQILFTEHYLLVLFANLSENREITEAIVVQQKESEEMNDDQGQQQTVMRDIVDVLMTDNAHDKSRRIQNLMDTPIEKKYLAHGEAQCVCIFPSFRAASAICYGNTIRNHGGQLIPEIRRWRSLIAQFFKDLSNSQYFNKNLLHESMWLYQVSIRSCDVDGNEEKKLAVVVHSNRAEALLRLGWSALANDDVQTALQWDPNHQKSKNRLCRIRNLE